MSAADSIYPVLILAAAGMSGINLYVLARLLPKSGGPPTLARAILVGYVLVASFVFWAVLPWALLAPNLTSYYTVLTLMTLPMPAPFVWMVAALYRAEEKQIAPGSVPWALVVALALLANELFMSISFTIALIGYSGNLAGLVGASINSVWFAGPMLATMGLLLILVPATKFERRALAGLAASVAVGPLLLASPVAGAVAIGAVMVAVLLLLLPGIRRVPHPTASEMATASAVAIAFVVMAGAQVASFLVPAAAGPNALPFGAASFFVMLAEGWVLVRRGLTSRGTSAGAQVPGSVAATPSTAA